MNAKRAPLPWRVEAEPNGVTYSIWGAGDDIDTYIAEAQTIDDAEFIVRACNTHDKLVAALEGLFEHCAMLHKHWGEGSNQKEADAAEAYARKVLAEAKIEGTE